MEWVRRLNKFHLLPVKRYKVERTPGTGEGYWVVIVIYNVLHVFIVTLNPEHVQ